VRWCAQPGVIPFASGASTGRSAVSVGVLKGPQRLPEQVLECQQQA
jgi:hypothetical protein